MEMSSSHDICKDVNIVIVWLIVISWAIHQVYIQQYASADNILKSVYQNVATKIKA